jgi:hypothetical protein
MEHEEGARCILAKFGEKEEQREIDINKRFPGNINAEIEGYERGGEF